MNQYTNPVTEEEHELIRRLHAEGKGRNDIARTIGRGQRTVSVIAQQLGLVFDCTWTEEATRHRMAQLAEKRTVLAEALTDDAMRLTEQQWEPAKVFNIGGKDNVYTEQEVPEPPSDAKRNLMAAAGIAIEKSLKLVPPAAETGAEDARSMLGALWTGLQDLVRDHETEASPGEEAEGESP
ncbi:hypothetical protein HRW18_05485 [Streptomyces lunaelactis]|uniref:helix-turn-helix domain-containing protein n=1 Tax=Streptomyces lunaelactis TaxID=1535768 RepID=UPI0015855787|nr:helix-turn-helix domain-containing protein [Streptomyces lunaelactis]NUK07475.1 hypothetical protein [Streptomyces lunaelactis]